MAQPATDGHRRESVRIGILGEKKRVAHRKEASFEILNKIYLLARERQIRDNGRRIPDSGNDEIRSTHIAPTEANILETVTEAFFDMFRRRFARRASAFDIEMAAMTFFLERMRVLQHGSMSARPINQSRNEPRDFSHSTFLSRSALKQTRIQVLSDANRLFPGDLTALHHARSNNYIMYFQRNGACSPKLAPYISID
ncbi:hypothetical protein [Paraburkholderia lycopersici]|uniref:hypothetical protein n=1 Tax=Paraburkholderia lycopersici TaxID=416944 RepID=UPI001C4093C7|nr:hypothetical protein [Paraburkholderia lycopersici]